ncbi:MAG: pentapeptide repeat-containing protein [Deinococcota bacterium]
MESDSSRIITPPKPLVKKNLLVNWTKISDVIGNAVQKNPIDAVKSLFQVLEIEQNKPNELAYELLISATFQTVTTHIHHLQNVTNTHELSRDVMKAIVESQDTLDYRFFEQPQDLASIEAVKNALSVWLEKNGVDSPSDFLKKFKRDFIIDSFFILANNQSKYSKLASFTIGNPVYEQYKKEIGRRHHHKLLAEQTNKFLLDDPENPRLCEVYISPRAYYEEEVNDEDDDEKTKIKLVREKHVVKLEDELDSWISNPSGHNDDKRIISGGPGIGKSSFITMFAAKYALLDDIGVLVIPLHRIDRGYERNLSSAINEYVKFHTHLAENPIERRGDDRWLIIFDGLDELDVHDLGESIAKDFIDQVDSYICSKNESKKPRFQIIISGRTLLIRSTENKFRYLKSILYIIPYHISKDNVLSRKSNLLNDPRNLLLEDQRDAWWEKYTLSIGEECTGMPDDLRKEDLDEITSQPLLSFLVAKSYVLGEINFITNSNVNLIYYNLIQQVYDREKRKGRGPVQDFELGLDDFFILFEEIAITVVRGNGRTATLIDIQKNCKGLDDNIIKAIETSSGDSAMRLLSAFYLRHSETESRAFEFTHKSIGEYLASRRLIVGLELMQETLSRRNRGVNQKEKALDDWIELCGEVDVDSYLFDFIQREILLTKKSTAQVRQDMLCEFFEYLFEDGSSLKNSSHTFGEQFSRVLNMTEMVLVMLGCYSKKTKKVSRISWNSSLMLGGLLSIIRNQRFYKQFSAILQSLNYLDLSNQVLRVQDLAFANFHKSIIRNVDFRSAFLHKANLSGADLSESDLYYAWLDKANLSDAICVKTDLFGASIERADLSHANFQGADLRMSTLIESNLKNIDLTNADLRGARLYNANFEGANLSGAKIREYQVEYIDLSITQGEPLISNE